MTTAPQAPVNAAFAEATTGVAFVLTLIVEKLERFQECSEDSDAGGCDIGREWFDALTTIGLLRRVQRSPGLWEMTASGSAMLATTPTPPAQEAKSAFTKALEIRTAQGWELTGEAIPVLYTDTINDQQVMRDDVWLCTTDALKPAQAAADARDAGRYRLVRRGQHWSVINGIGDTLRGDALDAAADAALATHQQGGSNGV